jgi:hypothetical protein
MTVGCPRWKSTTKQIKKEGKYDKSDAINCEWW